MPLHIIYANSNLKQSANDLSSYDKWVEDINKVCQTNLQFPIIADVNRKIAYLYDMINQRDLDNIAEKGILFMLNGGYR